MGDMTQSYIKKLGDALKNEKVDNSAPGKVFSTAREIHAELFQIQTLTEPKDLIMAAKNLTNLANSFVTYVSGISQTIKNSKSKDLLDSAALQVKHWAVQLKMLIAVRVAACDVKKTATEIDQYNNSVKAIVDSILTVCDHEVFGDEVPEEDPFQNQKLNWVSPWAKK